MKRLLQRLEGLWRHLREHPTAIWLGRHPVVAVRIDSPAISAGLFAEQQTDHQRRDIDHRFAIAWHKGIQIDRCAMRSGTASTTPVMTIPP